MTVVVEETVMTVVTVVAGTKTTEVEVESAVVVKVLEVNSCTYSRLSYPLVTTVPASCAVQSARPLTPWPCTSLKQLS